MSSGFVVSKRKTVGLADSPLALLAPSRVFARVEDVPAYGWSLFVLLTVMTLVGYAQVETGLIDREVDRRVQAGIAALEEKQLDVVERSALSQMIEDKQKEGEFLRLITRVQVIAANPLVMLATILLLSALFYGIVALGGKKPEWHTLMTICVFAAFADAAGAIIRLVFMLCFATLSVDTSLAVLTRSMDVQGLGPAKQAAALSGLLSAIDPFRVWFWIVMIVGLTTTAQLRRWKAWMSCTLFWLIAAGARAGLAAASVKAIAPA